MESRFGRYTIKVLASVVAAATGCAAPAASTRTGSLPHGERREGRSPRPVIVDPPAVPGSSAPNLVAGRPGEIVLTWVEPVGSGGHRVRLSRLSGTAWSEPTTVVESDRMFANWADVPVAVPEAAGDSLVVSWAEKSGPERYAYDVHLGRSTDGGATWAGLGRAHHDGTQTEHGFVAFAPGHQELFAFWLDGRETASQGPMTLRGARIPSGASSVGPGEVIDERVCDCCPTAAAITSEGPVVVYRDRDEREVRDISIARRVRGAWTPPATLHADGWVIEGCPVNGPAIAARGSLVAVAWYTAAGERPVVKVAFSRDAGRYFADPIEIDAPAGRRSPIGRVGLALDASGEGLVTWMAANGDAARILARRVAVDGRLGAERVIAATSPKRASGIPRAVLVADALLVAWTDVGREPSRIRVASFPLRDLGAPAAQEAPPRSAPERPATTAGAVVGQVAPAYSATSIDGVKVDLRDLRGNVVLLNLWATWCAPCLEEMPELVALHRVYARKNVRFVAATTDAPEARQQVLAAVKQRMMPFTIWFDPDDRASAAFGAPSLPVTLVIGKDGTIRYRKDGKVAAGDVALTSALDAALRE